MRIKNSINNLVATLISQFVILILTFISRRIFIEILGNDLLGVSSLFTNIITVLSLAELGIGSVIIVHLYKPILNNEVDKITKLMSLYKSLYIKIAGITLIAGIALIPFLDIIVSGVENISVNIYIVYLLFLANNIASYFFAYKKSLLIAHQKNYIITNVHTVIYSLVQLIQIVSILLTKNYIFYLVILILGNVIENIYCSYLVNKKYAHIKYNDKDIDKEEKKSINRDVRAMMTHKLGGIVVGSTDNIVISTFLGVYWVGIYSNYLVIITAITNFIVQFYNAVVAGIGNLYVEGNKEKMEKVFERIEFFTFWLYAFSSIALFVLLTPFIEIWLGTSTLSLTITQVGFMVAMFYFQGIRKPLLLVKDSTGLFIHDKYKPIVSVIVNLTVSIVLVQFIGIVGVFVGTIVSSIFVCFIWEANVVYKYLLEKRTIIHILKWIKQTMLVFVLCIFTYILSNSITINNEILNFIYKCIIVLVIPNITIIIFFRKKEEYTFFLNIVKEYKNKIINKCKKRKE